jgi:hypothetical protein
MRAYDRTLLANLGFSDPDKKEDRHDLACQYLAENGAKVLELFLLPERSSGIADGGRATYTESPWEFSGFSCEAPISKGEGQYKTTIGFLDLVVKATSIYQQSNWKGDTHPQHVEIAVEVKIGRVQVGDILRQVRLYREYHLAAGWLVATEFALSSGDIAVLKNEGIKHVLLGTRFFRWVNARTSPSCVPGEMTEI